MKTKSTIWIIIATLLVMVLVLASCGPAETEAPAVEPEVEEPEEEMEEPMAEVNFPYPAGGFLEKAIAGEYAGTTVTVDGPFTDADEVKFKESYAAFEDATGIRIKKLPLTPERVLAALQANSSDP